MQVGLFSILALLAEEDAEDEVGTEFTVEGLLILNPPFEDNTVLACGIKIL